MLIVSIFLLNSNVIDAKVKVRKSVAASQQTVKLVNVRKFGAKGDGVTDDYQSIINALNAVKDTSSVLYFPNGDYYCSTKILLNSSYSIKGESKEQTTITFRDCTKKANYDEWNQRGLFTFNGKSLSLSNITFRYIANTETKYTRTKTQTGAEAPEGVLVSVLRGDNINIQDSVFWVGGKANPSITCMWMKAEGADISNVNINRCKFENDTTATVGGCLWFSSHDNKNVKVNNVVISECEMLKHANDEALALWGFNVCDFYIMNNNITYSGQQVQNDVLISFGMPDPSRVESLRNIHFNNNAINLNGKCIAAVKFQLLSNDSYIDFSNNTIEGNMNNKTTLDCIWFAKSGTVDFYNNTINVKGGNKVSLLKKSHENDVNMKGNSFNRR